MTRSRYIVSLFISLFVICGVHHLIVHLLNYPISIQSALRIEGISLALIAIGTRVIVSEVDRKSEGFVARFMIMTTIQMLGILSIAVWISTSGVENYRSIVIHQMLFFIAAMAVQSLLLIASRKS